MPHTMPSDSSDRTVHAGGSGADSASGSGELRSRVREVMQEHWVDEPGYAVPNPTVYPYQWLWDSCFHAVIWLGLGEPERALAELRSALLPIDESGHVPHMRYRRDPQRSLELWGRRGSSSITQPPVYGHALAELLRAGVPGAEELVEPARRGLGFLLQRRRRDRSGLLLAVHPWETGFDDTPRFDDYCPGEGFERRRWAAHKTELLAGIERGSRGEPLANPAFGAAPVSFSAITARCGLELAAATGDDRLASQAAELGAAVDARWDPDLATWVDAGRAETGSGRVRTVGGLLGLLVSTEADRRALAEEQLTDAEAYGATFGPRGVHRDEPAYDPDAYWRGPVWPQLAYLLGRELSEAGAARLAETTRAGAAASGLAEYWNPETGKGGGAVPQCWAGLALLMGPGRAPGCDGSACGGSA